MVKDITPIKITPRNICDIRIPKASFFTNSFYLCQRGYFVKDGGEYIIFEIDEFDGNWNIIHLPKKEKYWSNSNFSQLTEEEMGLLESRVKVVFKKELAGEVVYQISDLLIMEGHEYHNFRKSIKRFEGKYPNHRLLTSYPKEKVLSFLTEWAEQKKDSDLSRDQKIIFESDFAMVRGAIKQLDQLENFSLFLEIDGELAGFRISTKYNGGAFGVTQKVLYKYEGIARFLYHEAAKQLADCDTFYSGTETIVQGVAHFKYSMRPSNVWKLYYASTGGSLDGSN